MKKSLLAFSFLMLFVISGQAQVRCEQLFLSPSAAPYDPNKSWGQQTFEKEFDALSDFFISNKNLPDADKVKALMKQDVRKTFFKLQALTRMFEGQQKEFFSIQRTAFKNLEDVVGKLDLATSLRKQAEAIQEPSLVAFFGKQESEAQVKLLAAMKASGLWEQPEATLAKLKVDFEKGGNWAIGAKEKDYFVTIVSDYAKSVHKSVKAAAFDNADIEKGLHELRRRLRWIVIQVMSLDGVVELREEAKLSKKVAAWFSKSQSVNADLLNNKYMKTSGARVQNPILVPKVEMALITELVANIGSSKDNAEMQIYFKEALDTLGINAAQKEAILKKLDADLKSEEIDHQALARNIQTQLADTKLLKRFVEALEEMN